MDITKFLSKLSAGQTFIIILVAILLPAFSSYSVSYRSNQTNEKILQSLSLLMDNSINHLDYRASIYVVNKTTNASKNAILRNVMKTISTENPNLIARHINIRENLTNKINNLYYTDINRLKMFTYHGVQLDICLKDVDPNAVSNTISNMMKDGFHDQGQLREDIIIFLDLYFDQIQRDSDLILLNLNNE